MKRTASIVLSVIAISGSLAVSQTTEAHAATRPVVTPSVCDYGVGTNPLMYPSRGTYGPYWTEGDAWLAEVNLINQGADVTGISYYGGAYYVDVGGDRPGC